MTSDLQVLMIIETRYMRQCRIARALVARRVVPISSSKRTKFSATDVSVLVIASTAVGVTGIQTQN